MNGKTSKEKIFKIKKVINQNGRKNKKTKNFYY